MTNEEIEQVARRMCQEHEINPDEAMKEPALWQRWRQRAIEAIAAYRAVKALENRE